MAALCTQDLSSYSVARRATHSPNVNKIKSPTHFVPQSVCNVGKIAQENKRKQKQVISTSVVHVPT